MLGLCMILGHLQVHGILLSSQVPNYKRPIQPNGYIKQIPGSYFRGPLV